MPKQRKPAPKPVKPRRAWALVKPNGRIDVGTVKDTQRDAIAAECWWSIGGATIKETWASHRAQGWRVVKVEIREVPK